MRSRHITADQMECYYLGRIREPELAIVEEHLLWCQECVERMEATERFIDLVRADAIRSGFDLEIP